MGRAAKPAKSSKPIAEKVAGEYSLNATEAFELSPLAHDMDTAQRRLFDSRARVMAHANRILERHSGAVIRPEEFERWAFDVRDDGVFLVRRES